MAVAPEEREKVAQIRAERDELRSVDGMDEQERINASHDQAQAWLAGMHAECLSVLKHQQFVQGLAALQRAAPPVSMTASELAIYRMGQRSVEYFLIDGAQKAQSQGDLSGT